MFALRHCTREPVRTESRASEGRPWAAGTAMLGHHTSIPRIVRDCVEQQLQPGERLVWMEQPEPRLWTSASRGAFIFAIPWTAFACFWTGMAFWMTIRDKNGPIFRYLFPLFGLPFVGVGFYLFSMPWRNQARSRRTAFAVTDRRILQVVSNPRGGAHVQSLDAPQIGTIERQERSDGTGSLFFSGIPIVPGPKGRSTRSWAGFVDIREPRMVEEIIRTMAGTHAARNNPPRA